MPVNGKGQYPNRVQEERGPLEAPALWKDVPCGACGKLGVKVERYGFLCQHKLDSTKFAMPEFDVVRCVTCNTRLDVSGRVLNEDGTFKDESHAP